MTHKTGPRKRVLQVLDRGMRDLIDVSGATYSEAFLAMQRVEMKYVRQMLKPWEDETCPTCPKRAALTKGRGS